MKDRLAKFVIVYCIQDVGFEGKAKDKIVTSDYIGALNSIKVTQDKIGI